MTPTTLLDQLPDGGRAVVARVVSSSREVDAVALRRLGELGFIPGEPVQLLRRGPGGREPLAVLVGETLFALRLLEAQCIEVLPEQPAEKAGRTSRGTGAASRGQTGPSNGAAARRENNETTETTEAERAAAA